jgi:heavy metal sensor kinase
MPRTLSIGAKLTLWYLAVISTALLLFGVLSYASLRYALMQLKLTTLHLREERLLLFLDRNRRSNSPVPLLGQLQSYATIAHEGNLVQIHNLDGSLIFPVNPSDAAWFTPTNHDCRTAVIQDLVIDSSPAAVMCHRVVLNNHPVLIYVGGSLEESLFILNAYRQALILLLPCLLAFAAMGGYFLSRRAMRPVDRMTKAAVGIGIGNLSSRLPVPEARDELWSLANAWNQLLDRLEGAVSRLSEFSADASHDLRTSITVILGTAQLALRRHHSEEERSEDLSRIVNECRTASTLLDALLSLARSDNFLYEVEFQRINISELVLFGCRRVEDLAEFSGIILDWELPADDLFINGDEQLLQRLLGILLDNAIKYTPEHGEILVEVVPAQSGISLIVRDTGIGMAEDVRQRIFDRFYQADLRERKDQAGSGLGLSIARWIAEAHRAELTVKSVPMQGSEFQIHFPASEMAMHSINVEPSGYPVSLR